MKKYRNEWKYKCQKGSIILLQNRLNKLLGTDPNSNKDGKYIIHSLYFDSYKDNCAIDNESGESKRYKWRIRYYENFNDKLKLEKKEKNFGFCHKESCTITKEQYNNILKNDIMNVFWNTDEYLLKEFCIDVMTKLFKPKIIIEYERIAYIEPILNIRITIDSNLSTSYQIDKFLDGNYIKIPLLEINNCILEVKFDDILPGYISNIVSSYKFQKTAFSKYYIGRKKIEEVLK